MSLYLDASVVVPTLVQEGATAGVAAFLAAAVEPLIVSELAAIETASALSRLVRADKLASQDAATRLEEFDNWRADVSEEHDLAAADARLANAFVRRFELGLRAPDALHVAACRRGDHTLVTLDQRMAAAAEALGVRVTYLG